MALIPTLLEVGLDTTINITSFPTYTYYVNRDTGRIVSMVDGADAMLQAIVKILWTERYFWLIYSWNYGIELNSLIGQDMNYVTSEFKRRVTDALLADDRVGSVTDFAFYQTDKDDLTAAFTANTVYGAISITTGVTV